MLVCKNSHIVSVQEIFPQGENSGGVWVICDMQQDAKVTVLLLSPWLGLKQKVGSKVKECSKRVKNDKEKKLLLWIMWHIGLLFDAAAYI